MLGNKILWYTVNECSHLETSNSQNSSDGHHYQSTSPDRPNLRPIPEHRHYQNGHHHGNHGNDVRRSPPTSRSRSADPYFRDLSPPSHAITAPGAPPQTYVAKGVRANTMVCPLRATGPASQETSKYACRLQGK